jgi:hypothetical protein
MRQRGITSAIFIAAALGAATVHAQTAREAAEKQPAGTLKVVTGDVRIMGSDYEERRVQPGDRIAASERLLTGQDSAASVVLRDGTVMALGPRTNVDLSRFAYNTTTQEGNLAVRIARGSLRMITGLMGRGNPDSIQVSTSTATIGIRGTDFIVNVEDAGAKK